MQLACLLFVLLFSLFSCSRDAAVSQEAPDLPAGGPVLPTLVSDIQEELTPEAMAHAATTLGGDSAVPSQQSSYHWPLWAQTARIAGAYFAPGNNDIDARLDKLAAQNVGVIIADSPLGERYEAWVDDEKFYAVKAVMALTVQKAHERGIKVVMYHTGLEVISDPKRNPVSEHPEWAQRGLDGTPLIFNDVTNEEQHWLNDGIWVMWLSPCDNPSVSGGSFRQLALSRIREMVETGIDGLWVDQAYLQSSVGSHHELWPSSDPCSAAAFTAATGLPLPTHEDWDDPVFRRWVVWRHSQITEFLLAEKEAARSINPDIVFLNENSSVDSGRSTYVATDPTALLPYADMTTGHEIETIADRMDEGETGMQEATLDDWLSFRTMVAFARAADRNKPSWILTYGYGARDSAQLAGLVLAEGANFYETKGPQMADTVGEPFRTLLFGWIASHETEIYASRSVAQVGLLYSPRTRDLIDTVSGEPYELADSVHFAAYRSMANLLYRAQVPFDVVIDTDVEMFPRYQVLIAPEVQLMSETTAASLHQFAGKLITIGDSGLYDEWLNPRSSQALSDISAEHFAEVDDKIADRIVEVANTGLLATTMPASVQMGIRYGPAGYAIVLVNTGVEPTPNATIELRGSIHLSGEPAHLSLLDGTMLEIPVTVSPDRLNFQVSVPSGIDTVALLTVPTEPSVYHRLPLAVR